MTEAIRYQADLPDYENPPVVETILGVQFERLPQCRNGHLGAFWKTLNTKDWPTVQDAPPLRPQYERFTEAARWGKGIQLRLTQDPATRIQIKNKDGDRMIQVQNGRLHFNWLGEAGGPYPRYAQVREGFDEALRRFTEFVACEGLGNFRPNQWEVTYLNHIPRDTVWRTPGDWGFFKPLGGVPTVNGLVEGEDFNGTWHFVIPERRGRLHVEWKLGVKSEPEEQELIVLTFTARGSVGKTNDPMLAVFDGIDLGRATIVRSFKESMNESANQYWGLKHVGN